MKTANEGQQMKTTNEYENDKWKLTDEDNEWNIQTYQNEEQQMKTWIKNLKIQKQQKTINNRVRKITI